LPVCKICGSSGDRLYTSLRDRLYSAPGSWDLVRCNNPDCGLLWISPLPDTVTLAQAYTSYYTHKSRTRDSLIRLLYERLRRDYVSIRFGYQPFKIQLWEKLAGSLIALIPHRKTAWDASVMWLPSKLNGRLLEIGCGAGENLAHLEKLGWQVMGIEPDPKAAAVARNRGLMVTEIPLNDSLFAAESFDAIIMSHVIEHLNNPLEVTRICHTLLRPDGVLIMLTPNTKSLGHRWYRENWLHLDPPRHLNLFNDEAIRLLVSGAGFKNYRRFTILRDANWTLSGSRALRDVGHYQIGKLPFGYRFLGMLLLYVEWVWMFIDQNCGEEIVMIARK
jgi:2-polyprenyl-3-methyl-5-hydroxy-6-metoxy-1,4-benzoquinol methylase